jgi:hypothetical protein
MYRTTPIRIPDGIPDYLPGTLKAQIRLVLAGVGKKFQRQWYIEDAISDIIAGTKPHFIEAVRAGSVTADAAIFSVGELLDLVIDQNPPHHRDALAMINDLKRGYKSSKAWSEFELAMADAAKGQSQSESPRVSKAQATDAARLAWQDIEICFANDQTVEVRSKGTQQNYGYDDFGFEDKKGGKPNTAWWVLVDLAKGRGTLDPRNSKMSRKALTKHVQKIRGKLKTRFGIEADPIVSQGNPAQYRTSFKIRYREPADEETFRGGRAEFSEDRM